MIKSSLFKDLFEGSKWNPNAFKQQDKNIEAIAKERELEDENKSRKERGLAPKRATAPEKTKPTGKVNAAPNTKEKEEAVRADYAKKIKQKAQELKAAEGNPKEEFRIKSELAALKQEADSYSRHGELQSYYGTNKAARSLYVLDKDNVDSLYTELSSLPFYVSRTKITRLLSALKTHIFSTDAINAKMQNPSADLAEVGKILGYDGKTNLRQLSPAPKYAFPTSHMKGSADPALAYPAIVGFVFPFIDPAILGDVLNRSNVRQSLADYANSYAGTLIKPIDWTNGTLPDFSNFEHISNPGLQKFLVSTKQDLYKGTDSFINAQIVTGVEEANSALQKSIEKSVFNAKHKAAILKNLYYSLITRAIPGSEDLFELDDKELKDKFCSGQLLWSATTQEFNKLAKNVNILTDNAYNLIAARASQVESDPFLHKGLFGRNVRKQLAFDYAKKVTFKLRQEALAVEHNKTQMEQIFDDLLHITKLHGPFDEIGLLLENYFSPSSKLTEEEPKEGSEETKISEAVEESTKVTAEATRAKLEALVNAAIAAVSNITPEHYGMIFDGLAAKSATLNRKFNELGKPEQFKLEQAVAYIQPYKEALITKCEELKSITSNDLKVIKSTADAILVFLGDITNKESRRLVRTAIESFKSYDEAKGKEDSKGYIYIRLVSKIQDKVALASRKLREKLSEPEGDESNTPVKKPRENAIHKNRRRILKTIRMLDPKMSSDLVMKLLGLFNDEIVSATVNNNNLMYLLVNGPSTPEETTQIEDFFIDLIDKAYGLFFNPAKDEGFNFSVFAPELADDGIIRAGVVSDLTEKSKAAILTLNGEFVPMANYFDGLSQELIDFVNLAASIGEYTGISADQSGNISFNYVLDKTDLSDGFFDTCVFNNDRLSVTQEPIMLLAFQRKFFARLQKPLEQVLGNITINDFLLPEVAQQQPALVQQLESYLDILRTSVTSGIPAVINQLDADIISQRGGGSIELKTLEDAQKENLASIIDNKKDEIKSLTLSVAETKKTDPGADVAQDTQKISILTAEVAKLEKKLNAFGVSRNAIYNIPNTKTPEYESVISALGTAIVDLWDKASTRNEASTYKFMGNLCVPANQPLVVRNLKGALDIISTALNIDIARRSFYGDDTQIAALKGLVRKYQSVSTPEAQGAIDQLNYSLTKANNLLSDFAKTTGSKGLEILTNKNGKIDNPLLAVILRKLNAIVAEDSWAAMQRQYSADMEEMRASGTAEEVPISKIVELLGISYVGTAVLQSEKDAAIDKLKQMFYDRGIFNIRNASEADKELTTRIQNAIKQVQAMKTDDEVKRFMKTLGTVTEEVAPVQLSQTSAEGLVNAFQQTDTGIKVKSNVLKNITKDCTAKILGRKFVSLTKNQQHGRNVQAVTSYSDSISEILPKIEIAVENVGQFMAFTGNAKGASSLVKSSETLTSNLETLLTFFDTIKNSSNSSVYNVELQRQLFNTLSNIAPEPSENPNFEEMFMHPSNKSVYENRLKSEVEPIAGTNDVLGAKHAELLPIVELMRSGKSLLDIKNEVITRISAMQEAMTADPELINTLNALPNDFYLDFMAREKGNADFEKSQKDQYNQNKEAMAARMKADAEKGILTPEQQREAEKKRSEELSKQRDANLATKPQVDINDPQAMLKLDRELKAKSGNVQVAQPVSPISHQSFVAGLRNPQMDPSTYVSYIATLHDPNTWAGLNPTEYGPFKTAATKFLAAAPQQLVQKANNDVQTGNLVNPITGQKIERQIEIVEKFNNKVDLAKALIEALTEEPAPTAEPAPEETPEQTPKTSVTDMDPLNTLAVILIKKGVTVSGSKHKVAEEAPEETPEQEEEAKKEKEEFRASRQTLSKQERRKQVKYFPEEPETVGFSGSLLLNGKEYNFEDLAGFSWLIYLTSEETYEIMLKVSKILGWKDSFIFQIGPDPKTATKYSSIFDFNRIKSLVLEYYNPKVATES